METSALTIRDRVAQFAGVDKIGEPVFAGPDKAIEFRGDGPVTVATVSQTDTVSALGHSFLVVGVYDWAVAQIRARIEAVVAYDPCTPGDDLSGRNWADEGLAAWIAAADLAGLPAVAVEYTGDRYAVAAGRVAALGVEFDVEFDGQAGLVRPVLEF